MRVLPSIYCKLDVFCQSCRCVPLFPRVTFDVVSCVCCGYEALYLVGAC